MTSKVNGVPAFKALGRKGWHCDALSLELAPSGFQSPEVVGVSENE